MSDILFNSYIAILKRELIPAAGCTEPIAIAYAAAKAREVLNSFPISIRVNCSGNVIKNVKGATIPNSGGLKGVLAAAILGAVVGDSNSKLEVLGNVTSEQIEKTKILLSEKDFCQCGLITGVDNLYIIVTVNSMTDKVSVEIESDHTHISKIVKNDKVIFLKKDLKEDSVNKDLLSVRGILEFSQKCSIDDIKPIITPQIDLNSAIADEGLKKCYGAQVGRTIIKAYGTDLVSIRACARAAAGSDARMNGCSLPVIINSGSGNQGITVCVPVLEYAKELKSSQEEIIRALALANLVAIHQKRFLGRLSAYCGVTSAACGAACGIAFLYNASYDEMCQTIINTIATIGGMFCDGAKSSCAAKIASAVNTGITAFHMSLHGFGFMPGDGLVAHDIEETISLFGKIGRVGMKETDIEILNTIINT